MAVSRLCSIPNCGKPHYARGWCSTHYQRWKNHGDPLWAVRARAPNGEVQRYFREVVVKHSGHDCLIWPYARNVAGYGVFNSARGSSLVSRSLCEELNGPPPSPEHQAAHSCGRGHLGCVTPAHLSWKTPAENSADKILHGSHDRGERQWMSKLAEDDVREIRSLVGSVTQKDLAERFRVSISNISAIQRRKSWAWLD